MWYCWRVCTHVLTCSSESPLQVRKIARCSCDVVGNLPPFDAAHLMRSYMNSIVSDTYIPTAKSLIVVCKADSCLLPGLHRNMLDWTSPVAEKSHVQRVQQDCAHM